MITALRNPLRDARGFSVVEMLLVFTILAVAILPLAAVQFQSRYQVSEAQRQTRATQIALAQIERARMVGFANAAGDTLDIPPFRATTRVVADPANPFLQEIQVTVSWNFRGEDQELVMAGKQASR